MCNFITATLPAGADSASFREAVKAAGLGFVPIENRYVQAQLLPNESYFQATRAMCDCTTGLRSRDVSDPKYDRTKKLRAKGWSEAKIAAWERTQGPRPRSRDEVARTGDLSLAQWLAFLRAALAHRHVPYVGLFQRQYRGSIYDEEFEIRRERRAVSELAQQTFSWRDDTLYEFVAG